MTQTHTRAHTPRLWRTRRHIRANWPSFFALYGALVAAVLLLGLGLAAGWYSFIPFALALIMVASYFLVAALWLAYQLHDAPGGTAMDLLLEYGQPRPDDRLVCIDLGLREPAILVAQRLTTGQATVIDVYNPQSNLGGTLRRARARSRKPPPDPRLNWIDGRTGLLPLPDRSVSAVYLPHILSEFWLLEERDQLLREAWRILVPNGRLLLAERVRARSHLLLAVMITRPLPPPEQWRDLLAKADFIVQREEILRGLVYCVRADKPSPTAARQLALNLEYL
ncbi:class I SAM-dependent methyltransferase [Promineifilum sp.]|uniref:class I SAM-dependent methyltransferase n=1 Tax=Promineifilum sp. TaxID=2664178 RepID=UPI0035B25CC3